jgi:hypothetical protein
MDRSPGFGSTPSNLTPYSDSVSLRLPYTVNLATENNSLTHYTKGTQSQNKSAPTACMHTVSGSISLPSPGFFSPFPHGTSSLSVSQEYLALEDGPPMFNKVSRAPSYSFSSKCPFVYGAITYYGRTFQSVPLKHNQLKGWSPFARRY